MNASSFTPGPTPASPPDLAMDALVLCFAGPSFKKNRRDPDDDDDEQAVKKLRAGSPSSLVSVLLFPPHRVLPQPRRARSPSSSPTPWSAYSLLSPPIVRRNSRNRMRCASRPGATKASTRLAHCPRTSSSTSSSSPSSPPSPRRRRRRSRSGTPGASRAGRTSVNTFPAMVLPTVIIPESREEYADRMSWNAKCWDSHLSRHAPEREDLLEVAASSTTNSSSIPLKAARALDAPKSAMAEDKQRVSVFDTIAANVASGRSVGSSTVDGSSRISPSATLAPDASKGATAEGKQGVSVFDIIAANAVSSCNVARSRLPVPPHWRDFLRPSVFNTGAAGSVFTASAGSSTTPQGKQQRVSAFYTAAGNTAFNTGADSGSSVLKDVSNTGARGRHLDKGKGKIGGHIFDAGVDLGSIVNIGKGFGWAPDRTDDIGGSLSGGSGVRRHKKYSGRGKVSRYSVY
ncbi:hypothetical protein B0H14DRAFT_2632923 [Mycena olivaceomarginata]|nr:hypothetical protein B0H14DRAFT_2632923 [Mycena olivaceomarginata]